MRLHGWAYMHIGVIGINHKIASLELRAALAQACLQRFSFGAAYLEGQACILLTTCNRTEIYFSSDNVAETHTFLLSLLRYDLRTEFDQKIYSYFGHDCLLHLCRVTAGLDSAIVAETEIQGQVKASYERAAAHISLPSALHYLFQKALQVGKQIRSSLSLGRGIPDLEHAIFQMGTQLFPVIDNTKVLLIGASEVNIKILDFLKQKKLQNITLCNRSQHKCFKLAKTYQLNILAWQHLNTWHHYDWIILGTKAPHYLIWRTDLPENVGSHKLVIDLGMPPNVHPGLADDWRITLRNIDQIHQTLCMRKQLISSAIIQAEKHVASCAQRYAERFTAKRLRGQPFQAS